MTNALTDDDWTAVQTDLRANIEMFRDVYGNGGARNQEIRYEDDDVVVFADASGHELNEIADATGVDRTALSRRMHEEARRHYNADEPGDEWSVADPIVVEKA